MIGSSSGIGFETSLTSTKISSNQAPFDKISKSGDGGGSLILFYMTS